MYGNKQDNLEEVKLLNTKLKILTLNIWWGNYGMDDDRLDKQIKHVKDLDCDIICLQEMFDIDCQRKYQNELNEKYKVFSSGIIEQRWLRYISCLCPNGIRRVIDGDTLGLVIFVKKDLNPIFRSTKKFTRQAIPDPPLTHFIESNFSKGFLSISITVNNKTINITNFHLNTGNKDDDPTRKGGYNYERIFQLKEMIDDSKDDMLILCGDTNSDLDTQPECDWLVTTGNCIDTYNTCHKEDEGFTWNNTNPYTKGWLVNENQRIDCIILNNKLYDNCELLDSEIVFNKEYVSDHFGVVTDIEL